MTNEGDKTFSILFGNGDGTFSNSISYSSGAHPSFVLSADMNNDGNVDLIAANSDGANTVTLLFGNGNGAFANKTMYTTGLFPTFVAADAFRDKTKLDLVVTSALDNSISFFFNSCP